MNKLKPVGGEQSFCSCLSPLDKFLLCKTNVCIKEGWKKDFEYYFQVSVSQIKGFLKETSISTLFLEQKIRYDNFIGHWGWSINLMIINVWFVYRKI